MIHICQAIVVEGKYDRMHLNEITDAPVIETGGFNLYKDMDKQDLIRRFSKETGIIILTDSDPAGRKLRSFIADIAKDGKVYHAIVPEIEGKEPRKPQPGAAGILGVEGVGKRILEEVLRSVAGEPDCREDEAPVTLAEWFDAGLTGGAKSKQKRAEFLKAHGLPGNLSQKQALRYLNSIYSPDELRKELLLYKKSQ